MFYSIDNFPFLKPFIDQADLISTEFSTARKNVQALNAFMLDELPELYSHTDYWSKETGIDGDTLGYDARNGTWGAFPIYKKGFPIKWYDVNKELPIISSLLKDVPELSFSSFMRLGPNSGTAPHAHKLSHLIFHLALFDNPDTSFLKCNEEEITFSKKGQYAIFDYSNMHSSFNSGKIDRVHLTIDFDFKGDKKVLKSFK